MGKSVGTDLNDQFLEKVSIGSTSSDLLQLLISSIEGFLYLTRRSLENQKLVLVCFGGIGTAGSIVV